MAERVDTQTSLLKLTKRSDGKATGRTGEVRKVARTALEHAHMRIRGWEQPVLISDGGGTGFEIEKEREEQRYVPSERDHLYCRGRLLYVGKEGMEEDEKKGK